MQELALLGVFAHPDDEQTMTGAFARAALEGMRTGLICATRGEVGEISDPALATPENLGYVREHELKAAMAVVGVKYLWFLDYRDSGMAGTPENEDARNFIKSDQEQALGKIVKIIREFKPTVMVTFEPNGGYGHPDHMAISRLATEAFDAAADPGRFPGVGEPWQAGRLYYTAFPRSLIKKMGEHFRAQGVDMGMGDVDAESMGLPDEEITSAVDTNEFVPLKMKSLDQHRTQMNPESPFNKLPDELVNELRGVEYYALVKGEPLPDDAQLSTDLFAGLRDRRQA